MLSCNSIICIAIYPAEKLHKSAITILLSVSVAGVDREFCEAKLGYKLRLEIGHSNHYAIPIQTIDISSHVL